MDMRSTQVKDCFRARLLDTPPIVPMVELNTVAGFPAQRLPSGPRDAISIAFFKTGARDLLYSGVIKIKASHFFDIFSKFNVGWVNFAHV